MNNNKSFRQAEFLLRLNMMNTFFENSLAVVLTLLFDETLCF